LSRRSLLAIGLLAACFGGDEREPDVTILHCDYQVVFTRNYADWMRRGRESGYRPFLSISSPDVRGGFGGAGGGHRRGAAQPEAPSHSAPEAKAGATTPAFALPRLCASRRRATADG